MQVEYKTDGFIKHAADEMVGLFVSLWDASLIGSCCKF
jgi:hypothetical protein